MADGPPGRTQLAPGDHVAAFYRSYEEKAQLYVAFNGVKDTPNEDTFSIGCGGNELEPDEYLSSEGFFSLPRLTESLRRRTRGPAGAARPARLAVDALTLAARIRNGVVDSTFSLQVWEEAAAALAADMPLIILCLYDWQRVDDGLAVRVKRCHSHFRHRGQMERNPVPLSVQTAFTTGGPAARPDTAERGGRRRRCEELLEAYRQIAETDLAQPPEELLDLALGSVVEIMRADAAILRVVDPISTSMPVVAHRGLKPETIELAAQSTFGRNLSGQVAETGQGELAEDALSDPRTVKAIVEAEGFASIISIPVKTRNRVIGVLNLASRGRQFTAADFRLAKTMVGALGSFVLQAVLYGEAMSLAHRMEAMARLTAAANFRLDPGTAETIVREAAFAMEADACAFWLFGPASGAQGPKLLAVHGLTSCLGLARGRSSGQRRAYGPVFSEAIRTGGPVVLDGHEGAGQLIVVPLAYQGQALGALAVGRSEGAPPFSRDHVTRASIVGSNLTLALLNRNLADARARQIEDARQAGLIGDQIVSILDIDEALAEGARLVSELAGGAVVSVWLPDPDGRLRFKVSRGPVGSPTDQEPEFKDEPEDQDRRSLVDQAFLQCRAVSVGKRSATECLAGFGQPGRTHICVPLKIAETAVGVMELRTMGSSPFDADRIPALESIADHLVAAIRNAELFREVNRARNELELIMANMGEALMVLAPDRTATFMNAAAVKQYGDQTGRPCYEFFVGRNGPCPDCPLPWDSPDTWTYRYARESVAGRLYDVVASGLQMAYGRAVVLITRDITDERRMQTYLTQHERMVALGEMASGIAHNFNNILTSILGTIDDLKRSPTRDKMQPAMRVIERAATDGADLVRRIQASTRVREEPGQRVDLAVVIQDAAHVTRPRWKNQAERSGRAIDVVCQVADGLWVRGHPAELRQVFINMILNSIDALPQGGLIEVTAVERGDVAEVRVMDNGIGMNQEVLGRLFQPFFTTKGKTGSGLGLSTAYNIINRHGGSIGVESAPGVGTTFTVTIPVAEDEQTENLVAVAEAKVDPGLPTKVLVVDDDQLVLEVLASLVAIGGHRVVTANRGAEAIRMLGEENFDVVITDLGMPEMSGWDVARAVRQRSPDIGIVLLTGWGSSIEEDEARMGLVDLILAKPVRVNELLAGITRVKRARLNDRPGEQRVS
ncbi:MAG: GAF domain-containing protein [Bacillota bacterium]